MRQRDKLLTSALFSVASADSDKDARGKSARWQSQRVRGESEEGGCGASAHWQHENANGADFDVSSHLHFCP